MKLAVYGSTGQLARALKRVLEARGDTGIFYDRADCDFLQNSARIYEHARAIPDVDGVIIAAAYTAVDAAETDRETAFAVNAAAPKAIAKACKERGLALIYISTDYVFSGTGTAPYPVNSPTGPLNVYGASKLAGENALREVGGNIVILRTSWVYDGIGKNFFTTMLTLGQSKASVNVVDDQIGRPTYAGHLAQAVCIVATKIKDSEDASVTTYHVSGSGAPVSWAGLADSIFKAAKTDLPHSLQVTGISSIDYPTPAPRPTYSVLDIADFENMFDYALTHWEAGLTEALDEWREQISH